MGCYGHVVDVKIDSRLEEVKFRWGERKEKISPPPPRRADSDIKTALQDTPRKVAFTRLHKSRWSRLMCPCISPNRWLSSPAECSLSGVHHGAREMVDLDSFYLFLFICIFPDISCINPSFWLGSLLIYLFIWVTLFLRLQVHCPFGVIQSIDPP